MFQKSSLFRLLQGEDEGKGLTRYLFLYCYRLYQSKEETLLVNGTVKSSHTTKIVIGGVFFNFYFIFIFSICRGKVSLSVSAMMDSKRIQNQPLNFQNAIIKLTT